MAKRIALFQGIAILKTLNKPEFGKRHTFISNAGLNYVE